MKLQHLPIGARFEYEGQVFVKTGPMTASSEESGQRIIPRYATLKPLDVPPAEPQGKARRLDEARVRAAFAAFYETACKLTEAGAHPELEAARERFLAALK